MSDMRDMHQPGLGWEHNLFGDVPIWTKEPSINIIKKLARQLLECDCDVAFLAQGTFNKVYSVHCNKGEFVFRVALPVAPKTKTLSDVATISFIRSKTSMPVPKVMAYNADLNNELGFEWILMERVNGRPLRERWNEISWLKKGLLIRKMVEFMSQLSHIELRGIGSLYEYHLSSHLDGTAPTVEHVVGETVIPAFFMGDHIRQDLSRGPYQTSTEYVAAHAQFLLHDIQNWCASGEEIQREDGEEAQLMYDKLQLIIPKLFPDTGKEPTFICHQDLSANNILIDDSGDLVGIIDWECVIAVPRWQACKLPQFLNGGDHDGVPEPLTEEQQRDEEVVEYYNDCIHDYEQTQLRRYFLEEMAHFDLQWIQAYNEGATRRDVMVAIESVDDGMRVKFVKAWLDCLLEGRTPKVTLFQAVMDPWALDNDWA